MFKDKSGREVKPGDFIVYGHIFGRCAGLQYGKILDIVSGRESCCVKKLKLKPGYLIVHTKQPDLIEVSTTGSIEDFDEAIVINPLQLNRLEKMGVIELNTISFPDREPYSCSYFVVKEIPDELRNQEKESI